MGMPENVYELDKMTHKKVASLDRKRTFVLQAVSPMEVHGPHLPIGQDLFESVALARETVCRLAPERPDWSFILMPPLPVAIDCLPHAGSVNYPINVVYDVAYHSLKPFANNGFARLAYSAFHGSPRHICALEQAAFDLNRHYKHTAAVSLFSAVVARMLNENFFYEAVKDDPSFTLTEGQVTKDTHAGFIETSLALHLWPELVAEGWENLPHCTKNAEEEQGRLAFGKDESGGGLKDVKGRIDDIARSVTHFKKHTYNGYPSAASAALGKRIFDHIIEICKNILNEFIDKGRAMDGRSPLWKFRGVFLNKPINSFVDNVLKLYSE